MKNKKLAQVIIARLVCYFLLPLFLVMILHIGKIENKETTLHIYDTKTQVSYQFEGEFTQKSEDGTLYITFDEWQIAMASSEQTQAKHETSLKTNDKALYNHGTPYTLYDIPLNENLQKYAQDLARAYQLNPKLLFAIMEVESGFQENVISATNDYGLMQINEINKEQLEETLGITDLLDPYQNIQAGAYILANIEAETIQDKLLIYNNGKRGAENLKKHGIVTTHYTNKVAIAMEKLEVSDD